MNKLINANGKPQYGWIKEPVSEVNYLDFPLTTTMDKQLSVSSKKRKFNQFHFIGVLTEDFMAGLAIVDLKLVSNCFFYVWTKEQGLLIEKSVISPFGLGARLSSSPDEANSHFSFMGTKASIEQSGPTTRVRLNSKQVQVDFSLHQGQNYEPLRVCSQAGYTGWVYTQKTAGLEANGHISIKGQNFDLKAMNALGSVDWSCGYMRRETAWNWACFSGRDELDRTIGLNLASGVNETGTTENGLWVDGKLHKLGGVRFEFDRNHMERPWRVVSECGRVTLEFHSQGCRSEKLNVGLLASNFKQMFGHYSGSILDDEGNPVVFKNVPGYAEDHYAKW
ncbi:DUF2804 domain-containing protein [Litoribrevibacter albus]|nr:DUF2804 domain-containing protein [Litoribrevibacter albus]